MDATAIMSAVHAVAVTGGMSTTVPESGTLRLGNVNSNVKTEHTVSLSYTRNNFTRHIRAPAPPNFNLDIQSNWTQKNGVGLGDALSDASSRSGSALARAGSEGLSYLTGLAGMNNATMRVLTAHQWDGSSPVQLTIPFEFIAEKDPVIEVIEPVRELYKLASASLVSGALIPPGPSVIGTETKLEGLKIVVQIGTMFTFANVIVDNVSGEIDTRVTSKNGAKILHAKIDVSFTSFFTVTTDDIDAIFAGTS